MKNRHFTFMAVPTDKPHYVMGVGTPEELVEGVKYELICLTVIPTRMQKCFVYTSKDNKIKNSIHKNSTLPLMTIVIAIHAKIFQEVYIILISVMKFWLVH